MNQRAILISVSAGMVFGLIVVIVVATFPIETEIESQQRAQDQYCEMVALWKTDAHLPQQERRGWPPYRGTEVCDEQGR